MSGAGSLVDLDQQICFFFFLFCFVFLKQIYFSYSSFCCLFYQARHLRRWDQSAVNIL